MSISRNSLCLVLLFILHKDPEENIQTLSIGAHSLPKASITIHAPLLDTLFIGKNVSQSGQALSLSILAQTFHDK